MLLKPSRTGVGTRIIARSVLAGAHVRELQVEAGEVVDPIDSEDS